MYRRLSILGSSSNSNGKAKEKVTLVTELAGNDGKMRRGSGCFSRSLPMATNSFNFTLEINGS